MKRWILPLIFLSLITLQACLSAPSNVQTEFEVYDGKRPNNFSASKTAEEEED